MRVLSATQGAFYIAGGIWPLVSLKSFERATGPKTDGWLVKTTGSLIAVVGLALLASSRNWSRQSRSLAKLIGLGSATTLGTASGWYAARGRISRVYFIDAAIEVLFAMLWLKSEEPRGPRLSIRPTEPPSARREGHERPN
jgi:hypothetical protein